MEVIPDGAEGEDDTNGGQGVRREPAEGLPVPVVPGSRTTEARAEPPSPRHPALRRPRHLHPGITVVPDPVRPPTAKPADLLTVTGRLSATEERAREDARAKLERLLSERLAPGVPRQWKAPSELINGTIRLTQVVPVSRDYGTVYEATITADFSAPRLAEIVDVYHRQQVVDRLVTLGALLAFVLACLAAVSGYIKADEATKGYYTTRLRLASAAGVGAAGVIIYRMLV